MIQKFLMFILSLSLFGFSANSQSAVGVKTNLLSDAFADVNLGVEIGLAPRWSLDLTGDFNGWNVNRHKWRHWAVQPEARYWFCDRFEGHFLGLHAIGGQYNFVNIHNSVKFLGSNFSELSDYRFQGWAAGAGIAYGYDWILGKHWNLEAEIGIGWMYTRYTKFPCAECGTKLESDKPHNYFGPTKAAINLIYLF